jgi:hypothetical protein
MQAVNLDDDPVRSHLKEQFLLSAAHLAEQKHREASPRSMCERPNSNRNCCL